jgi:uncharacterized RDD family membrane protein YckC
LNCPSCRRGLPAGVGERCPFCGALIAPAVEGALAPDLRREPDNVEPLREIPGLRKRERTWQDEVRDRVRQRRQEKAGPELPLFPDEDEAAVAVADAEPEPAPPGLRDLAPDAPADDISPLSELGEEPPALGPARVYDLGAPPVEVPTADDGLALRPERERRFEPEVDPFPEDELELPIEPRLDHDRRAEAAPAPPERPAQAAERAQAAVLDLGVLLGAWGIVVYFASRAAHVTVAGLLPSWPYLAAYLGALGLLYAGYFTGTTGQTLGKMALGLRVVDRAGRPPGYLRALGRAVCGTAGVLAAGAALVTVAFDPARRALHDRVFQTRVVRS